MNSPRLCAIDVDGTLVDENKNISASNSSGIATYLAANGKVVLASGRMHSSIRPYAVQLSLPDDDLILSYNGAMAKSVSGEILFERPVPATLAEEIVAFCRSNKLYLNYYYSDQLYVSVLDEHSELYARRSGSESIPIGDLDKMSGKEPTKLLIIDEPALIVRLFDEMKVRYHGLLSVTRSDDEYLEFMAHGVDKATGLAEVAARLNVDRAQVAAFGDSYNDVQMISWAGLGIAMSTGRDAAKSVADLVVANEDWSGVGDTLKVFVSQSKNIGG